MFFRNLQILTWSAATILWIYYEILLLHHLFCGVLEEYACICSKLVAETVVKQLSFACKYVSPSYVSLECTYSATSTRSSFMLSYNMSNVVSILKFVADVIILPYLDINLVNLNSPLSCTLPVKVVKTPCIVTFGKCSWQIQDHNCLRLHLEALSFSLCFQLSMYRKYDSWNSLVNRQKTNGNIKPFMIPWTIIVVKLVLF